MDKYATFEELRRSETEEEDYRIHVRPIEGVTTVVIAPHGGGIEPGTSELATAIAANDLGLACFEGLKNAGNRDLHITSTNFNVPKIVALVARAEFVLVLHGEESEADTVYLGGADQKLGAFLRGSLGDAGFTVERHERPDLQGESPWNICNRGRREQGVQLELARGLRESLFSSLSLTGRRHTTGRFSQFVDAVRHGLHAGGAL